jgi:hypothetical protein
LSAPGRTILLSLLWQVNDTLLMIHALLVVAAILFVLWLLFHATGGLVNLIWLVIIVLVALWLFGFVRGRSAR